MRRFSGLVSVISYANRNPLIRLVQGKCTKVLTATRVVQERLSDAMPAHMMGARALSGVHVKMKASEFILLRRHARSPASFVFAQACRARFRHPNGQGVVLAGTQPKSEATAGPALPLAAA